MPGKHEDLRSDPSPKVGMAVHASNCRAGGAETNGAVKLTCARLSERPCIKHKEERDQRRCESQASTSSHTYPYTYTHINTHEQVYRHTPSIYKKQTKMPLSFQEPSYTAHNQVFTQHLWSLVLRQSPDFRGWGMRSWGVCVCVCWRGHRLRNRGEEVGFINTRKCNKTLKKKKERGKGNLEGY